VVVSCSADRGGAESPGGGARSGGVDRSPAGGRRWAPGCSSRGTVGVRERRCAAASDVPRLSPYSRRV